MHTVVSRRERGELLADSQALVGALTVEAATS
jgi:hypothetical protein